MTAVHRFQTLVGMLAVMAAGVLIGIPSPAQSVPQAVAVSVGDYAFSPREIDVTVGRPVILTLTNTDRLTPHTFTLQHTDAGLDIDTEIGAGQSVVVEFTPRVAGRYGFYCRKKLPFMKSHRDRGMEGTLTVHGAASD